MNLTRGDFARACQMAKELGGIHFDDSKRALLHARLSKRARNKGFPSIGPYLDFVKESGSSSPEATEFINSLTTNKTAFFREAHHFSFLVAVVAKRYLERHRRGLEHGPLRVWSAAASRGHEAYSAAMVLADALAPSGTLPSIYATDIDTETLQTAKKGTYPVSDMQGLPLDLRNRRFQRGVDSAAGHWRVKKVIRDLVSFAHLNLTKSSLAVSSKFHVIFCRNVLFYFDEPTQRQLLHNLSRFLLPGGFLIMGHSENIQELSDEFTVIDNTIYRRRGDQQWHAGIEESVSTNTSQETPTLAPRQQAIVVGDCEARADDTTLTTILGSCLAVCLYDSQRGCGGMCHFALPSALEGTPPSSRYGEHALPRLMEKLKSLGAKQDQLKAKVFGACEVDSTLESPAKQNLQFAYEFLRATGIPIVAERVGTQQSLEVHLKCSTGAARIRNTDGKRNGS